MSLIARKPEPRLLDLVVALGGRWHGYHAMCRCPVHADRTPSLSLRQGDRGILVTCFAGCDSIEVLRALRRVEPSTRAALGPLPGGQRSAFGVRRLWAEAVPITRTPAEDYLASRGLILPLADIRYHARCPLGPKPRTRFLPALLVAVRVGRDVVAVQRIFLRPDRWHGPKVMLGAPEAGAWRGAEPSTVLAVAEGFETAAAYAQLNDVPAWSSLGARRLDRLLLPPTLTRLEIAEDADLEGASAAVRSVTGYARPDLEIVRRPPPHPFEDWAAVLEAEMKRGGGSAR